jgi:hypothetical protein
MSIPWSSLKLRLAVTVALLMGLGVTVTVVHAVRETQERAEQSIVESSLGAGQVAAVLSARVVEHQRARRRLVLRPMPSSPGSRCCAPCSSACCWCPAANCRAR